MVSHNIHHNEPFIEVKMLREGSMREPHHLYTEYLFYLRNIYWSCPLSHTENITPNVTNILEMSHKV